MNNAERDFCELPDDEVSASAVVFRFRKRFSRFAPDLVPIRRSLPGTSSSACNRSSRSALTHVERRRDGRVGSNHAGEAQTSSRKGQNCCSAFAPSIRWCVTRWKARIRRLTETIADGYGATAEIECTRGHPVVFNSEAGTEFARKVAEELSLPTRSLFATSSRSVRIFRISSSTSSAASCGSAILHSSK
ncbi:hypothetical protein FHX15_004340 [Rhizobium sp. BK650]|nr:hypothetical protein [Rhizobium sp. BK650]